MTEVFPSNYRGIGVGTVCFIGRMGNVFAPYTSNYLQQIDVYPQLSYGLAAIIGIIVVIPGDETFQVNYECKCEEDFREELDIEGYRIF